MTVSRRKAIAIIGGGTVFAVTAASTGFLITRTPGRALEPWARAGGYDDPRLNALSFALLAPNPHNLQPWQIAMEGGDALTLHRDPNLRLAETDPFDRQITIGLGCFLEQMVLAAGAADYAVELELFPQGENGPVAYARFSKGGRRDPLADYILERRSCKEPYKADPLDSQVVSQLETFADIHTEPEQVAALRELTLQAWDIEAHTPRTMQESVDLMRFGKSEIEANPDGIALGGAFLEALMLAGVLDRSGQSDPQSTGFKQGVAMYQDMLMATPAYAAIKTKGNSRRDQIDVGRQWLRLNLHTTSLGLSLHPVSQALQEYREMADHRAAAHKLLAEPGETVQMLGRLGYGPKPPRTPRWPLEAKLLNV